MLKISKRVLIDRIEYILRGSIEVRKKHHSLKSADVDYITIFTYSYQEYDELIMGGYLIGKVIEEREGVVFILNEELYIDKDCVDVVKICEPDKNSQKVGRVDLNVKNYNLVKRRYMSRDGFFLVKEEDEEKIEVRDSESDVVLLIPCL